jgi:hypothetical protein
MITLIEGWNWYVGADTSAIGTGQYDFQTIVTHELGHALGLGHSSDATSVMYGVLAAGVAQRTLTTADLAIVEAQTETGPTGLRVAGSPKGLPADHLRLHQTSIWSRPMSNDLGPGGTAAVPDQLLNANHGFGPAAWLPGPQGGSNADTSTSALVDAVFTNPREVTDSPDLDAIVSALWGGSSDDMLLRFDDFLV